MRRLARLSLSIGLRRKLGEAMKALAPKAAKKMKSTIDDLPLAPNRTLLVQVTDRSRGIVVHRDGIKEDNTPLSKRFRTRRSSIRSPSTAWPF
jgi:hypothetical protein